MNQTVLAMMAGLLCALAGLRYAAALHSEAARLRRWTELFSQLALILSEQALPLPAALRSAADGTAPPDRLLCDVADAMEKDPLLTLQVAFEQLCPDTAERPALMRFIPRLSRGSAESRALAARQAHDALAFSASRAEARAAKDAKLWQTLGWTGGLCLALLLL